MSVAVTEARLAAAPGQGLGLLRARATTQTALAAEPISFAKSAVFALKQNKNSWIQEPLERPSLRVAISRGGRFPTITVSAESHFSVNERMSHHRVVLGVLRDAQT
jgi:hypothetical protein